MTTVALLMLVMGADADSVRIAEAIRIANERAREVKEVEARDYTACLLAVDAGLVVYLAVGVDAEKGDYTVKSLEGITPGRYECRREAGQRVMRPVRAVLQALPSVQFTGPFGGGLRIGGS